MSISAKQSLTSNWQIQRDHYNRKASKMALKGMPWELDPRSRYGSLQAPYEFIRQWFAQQLLQGKSLLDFGCGVRTFSMHLVGRDTHIMGIDISEQSVELAAERARLCGVSENVTFRVGNCEALDIANASFDYVFSCGVLSFVDIRKALSEMARVLKPGGTVIVVDTLGHNPILNLNRKIQYLRGRKTRYAIDHILKKDDLAVPHSYFANVEYHYFDLLTLTLLPLSMLFRQKTRSIVRCASKIDQWLFTITALQRYAYKFVGIFSSPYMDSKNTL